MSWYMDEYPTNSLFPVMPESAMVEPWPRAYWRQNNLVNGGYPYHDMLPLVERISPPNPVEEKPYITIYDKNTKQTKISIVGILPLLTQIKNMMHLKMNLN